MAENFSTFFMTTGDSSNIVSHWEVDDSVTEWEIIQEAIDAAAQDLIDWAIKFMETVREFDAEMARAGRVNAPIEFVPVQKKPVSDLDLVMARAGRR